MKFVSVFCILFLCLVVTAHATEKFLDEVTHSGGEKSSAAFDLNLDNFRFVIQNSSREHVQVSWKKDTIEWIRVQEALVLPRAILTITVSAHPENLLLVYGNHTYAFHEQNALGASAQLFVSLFHNQPIKVVRDGQQIAVINIEKVVPANSRRKEFHHEDYSCSKYNIEFSGLDYEYLSYGCFSEKTGSRNSEKKVVHVLWVASNVTSPSQSSPPYHVQYFLEGKKDFYVNVNQQLRVVSVHTKFDNEVDRLYIAGGLGPYKLRTKENASLSDNVFAPAVMLYLNYELTKKSSIRAFDAAVGNKSYFNNLGIYFGYEVAKVLDNRVDVVAMFGAQAITFKFASDQARTMHEYIFPQGFEVAWRHAFGFKNYTLGYGAFISPTDTDPYINTWIRFGPQIFFEINYIAWEKNLQKARMWGATIGFPLGSFL